MNVRGVVVASLVRIKVAVARAQSGQFQEPLTTVLCARRGRHSPNAQRIVQRPQTDTVIGYLFKD